MQNNSVNKGIFHFLGATIWVPMPVYWYENPSANVTDSLPIQSGGLGILSLSEKTCNKLENSLTTTTPLVALIITKVQAYQMQPK